MRKVRLTAIICGIISMVATIGFYLLAFKDLFTTPNGLLPLALLLIAEVVGIVKVYAAAGSAVCHMEKVSRETRKTRKKLSKLNQKYKAIILDDGERKIDTIANMVGRDYNTAKQDIQGLINQEILKNAYINEIKRELMFFAPQSAPNVHVNVHQLSNATAYPSTTDNNISLSKQDSDNSTNNNNADVNSSATVTETETETSISGSTTTTAAPSIRPRVVSCPCCGANNIVIGDIGQCDYCLTPIT